jgi:hypothetical protein
MTNLACCIRDGCGMRFDTTEPELRDPLHLRSFWQRYCPKHRWVTEPNPPVVNVPDLATLARTVKALWAEACKFDGIPAESKFVVLSDENPYSKAYNEAMGDFMEALKAGVQ